MQPDNTAAYNALKIANDALRAALAIAAVSPIPSGVWNDYGRAMELQTRAMDAIKPKTKPMGDVPSAIGSTDPQQVGSAKQERR